jgi:glutathione S-transferase
MLTVHHLGISQSERIVWLCEELGLPYELKRYDRRADNRLAPDDYKALHPMGIAPVITDGDLVLGESGAICDYLCALPTSRLRQGGSTSPLAPAASGQGRAGVEETIGGRLVPKPTDPDFADHLFWFTGPTPPSWPP